MAVGIKQQFMSQELVFEFPEVHRDAVLKIAFHRTLRVPDTGHKNRLPPSLGHFPLKNIDDLKADRLPGHWPKRGGIVLPMFQSEAMWLSFQAPTGYKFAIKIACGKINAITGKPWSNELDFDEQDFVVAPDQPWIDGFAVTKGVVRQFVAMPLGSGHSVEEQVTGKAEFGGIQIIVYPLKATAWERMRQRHTRDLVLGGMSLSASSSCFMEKSLFSASPLRSQARMAPDMGIAQGGSIEQEIFKSKVDRDDWGQTYSRCFVAIANSLCWQHITGQVPPHMPPTAKDYAAQGLPWFDYYADSPALNGSEILSKVKTVAEIDTETGVAMLPENEGMDPKSVKTVLLGPNKRPALPRTGADPVKEVETW